MNPSTRQRRKELQHTKMIPVALLWYRQRNLFGPELSSLRPNPRLSLIPAAREVVSVRSRAS